MAPERIEKILEIVNRYPDFNEPEPCIYFNHGIYYLKAKKESKFTNSS